MPGPPYTFPEKTVVGAWRLLQRLGVGGQAAVWAAKPVATRRSPQRALKVCFAQDAQSRARFEREVTLLRECDHHHVLRIYDANLEWRAHVADAPEFAYYVSEKCLGSIEDHSEHLGDIRARLKFYRQACNAVSYLHSRAEPILHRDIKPANLFMAAELGNVVLGDFGIARRKDEQAETALTQAFEVVGTPFYRAPEVNNGNGGSVRSDVYCLGRVLEWLATGAVSEELACRPVPRGAEIDDDVCDLLDRVITTATQANPVNRYASVQELVDQLPELWLAIRPKPTVPAVSSKLNDDQAVGKALELVRGSDRLGWREQEGSMRREFADAALVWRKNSEARWRADQNRPVAEDARWRH